jgi:hypothetical protein
VLLDRATDIDTFVLEHPDAVPGMKAARESKDRIALRDKIQEIRAQLKPVFDKGRLEERLAAVMSDAQAAEMRALVDKHVAMVEAKRAADTGREPPKRPRRERHPREMALAEALEVVTHELPRSYKRILETQRANVDDLFSELDLDPETEARVRRVFREAGAAGRDNIDRRQLITDIALELTPEQRRAFARLMAGRRQGAMRP